MVDSWANATMTTLMPVREMERAIAFYTKKLGAKVMFRGGGEMKDNWASLRLGREEFWLITASKPERRTLAYQAFLVRDIRRTVAGLGRKGVKFERGSKGSPQSRVEGPLTIEPFGISAFFKDSEGNLLMVWQNDPPM